VKILFIEIWQQGEILWILPRNILCRNVLLQVIDSRYVAKISDFGMSRLLEEQQQGQTNANIGPIRWMVIHAK
jgi:hypothetical protein